MSIMGCISTNLKRANTSSHFLQLTECMQGNSQVPFKGLQVEKHDSCLYALQHAGVHGWLRYLASAFRTIAIDGQCSLSLQPPPVTS